MGAKDGAPARGLERLRLRKEYVRQMNTAERLSSLKVQHEQLEHELSALRRRAHLTPSEEMRARVIKKQKLQTKDHIRLLMSHARNVR